MPVFISHRTADNAIALQVAARLRNQHNITCYIDDLDKEAQSLSGSKAITELIVKRLTSCTNLLAIVTANTSGSWWVPFEIGVARQAPRVITTFTNLPSGLPEYLQEWPILKGENAIDIFARLYKEQSYTLNQRIVRKSVQESVQLDTVNSFHRTLKSALGQR